jgi:uncharacterized membrane protein YphA (DoxX/SURF4 family)
MAIAISRRQAIRTTAGGKGIDKGLVALWTAQAALAALFIFAGGTKLVMSGDDITGDTGLPVLFMRFIGVMELLGGIGVIAPALLRFQRYLTPLAAAGLAIIMIGATVVTLVEGMIAPALVPFAVGIVAGTVVYGRRAWFSR